MENEEKDGRGRRVGVGEEKVAMGGGEIRKGERRGNKSEKQYRRITRKGDVTDEASTVAKVPRPLYIDWRI